jgi:hypothetical protein
VPFGESRGRLKTCSSAGLGGCNSINRQERRCRRRVRRSNGGCRCCRDVDTEGLWVSRRVLQLTTLSYGLKAGGKTSRVGTNSRPPQHQGLPHRVINKIPTSGSSDSAFAFHACSRIHGLAITPLSVVVRMGISSRGPWPSR